MCLVSDIIPSIWDVYFNSLKWNDEDDHSHSFKMKTVSFCGVGGRERERGNTRKMKELDKFS